MPIIDVIVRSRTASHVGKSYYVCGNGDFVVRFDFDAEWDRLNIKTARFVDERGAYTDVVFSGSDCPMPVMSRTNMVKVGVFAGDLQTTTPARILAAKSILCDGGVPADPTPDVYNQIMELLNNMGSDEDKLDKNQGVSNAGMLLYVSDSGMVHPLTLGDGLRIVDGVLTITNAQTVRAICGKVLAGQVKCGEV